MNMLGLHPINIKSTFFDTQAELKEIRRRYHGKLLTDLGVRNNMIFVNNMSCLEALILLNKTFSLSLTAYKKVLRDYYIYFDGVMVILAEIPFCVVAYIYNHIFWAQDSSLDEIKVGDIDRFTFEVI